MFEGSSKDFGVFSLCPPNLCCPLTHRAIPPLVTVELNRVPKGAPHCLDLKASGCIISAAMDKDARDQYQFPLGFAPTAHRAPGLSNRMARLPSSRPLTNANK
jgi:hypothetical protein